MSAPVESVTYRFYIAYDAIFATVAVPYCPILRDGELRRVFAAGGGIAIIVAGIRVIVLGSRPLAVRPA